MSTMQNHTPVEQFQVLNARIESYSAEESQLRHELSALRASSRIETGKRLLLGAQIKLRTPAKSFSLWTTGVLIVGPLLAGTCLFVFLTLFGSSFRLSLLGCVAAGTVTAPLLAIALLVPRDQQLQEEFASITAANNVLKAQQSHLRRRLAELQAAQQADLATRDSITRSLDYRRQLLLDQNWRGMRGDQWEQFLAEVFRLLGANVQENGRTGDQGVDLIVELSDRRYAIQAKGYSNSVGNAAVQAVVAGMFHYGCTHSAVVTNSRFTQSAISLASSNRCLLIGEDEIPALILGQLAM